MILWKLPITSSNLSPGALTQPEKLSCAKHAGNVSLSQNMKPLEENDAGFLPCTTSRLSDSSTINQKNTAQRLKSNIIHSVNCKGLYRIWKLQQKHSASRENLAEVERSRFTALNELASAASSSVEQANLNTYPAAMPWWMTFTLSTWASSAALGTMPLLLLSTPALCKLSAGADMRPEIPARIPQACLAADCCRKLLLRLQPQPHSATHSRLTHTHSSPPGLLCVAADGEL